MPKKIAVPKEIHLYLTDEDAENFVRVKQAMVDIGLPISAIGQQDIIRFALKRASGRVTK